MTIDSSQFWNLLSESGLVRGADLHDLNATYDAARAEIDQQPEFQGLSEVETLSKWLVQQKVLSGKARKIMEGWAFPQATRVRSLVDVV